MRVGDAGMRRERPLGSGSGTRRRQHRPVRPARCQTGRFDSLSGLSSTLLWCFVLLLLSAKPDGTGAWTIRPTALLTQAAFRLKRGAPQTRPSFLTLLRRLSYSLSEAAAPPPNAPLSFFPAQRRRHRSSGCADIAVGHPSVPNRAASYKAIFLSVHVSTSAAQ